MPTIATTAIAPHDAVSAPRSIRTDVTGRHVKRYAVLLSDLRVSLANGCPMPGYPVDIHSSLFK
jgi:hypothetical protein